ATYPSPLHPLPPLPPLPSSPTRRSSDLAWNHRHSALHAAYQQGIPGKDRLQPDPLCVPRPAGRQHFLLDSEKAKDQKVSTYFVRSEEHTSELQSRFDLVCRLLLEKRILV